MKTFSKREFQELCEYVCRQMTPSNSKETDREALYFAIYWKICDLTGERLFLPQGNEPKILDFRAKISQSLIKVSREAFDASVIADRIIHFYVDRCWESKKTAGSDSVPLVPVLSFYSERDLGLNA